MKPMMTGVAANFKLNGLLEISPRTIREWLKFSKRATKSVTVSDFEKLIIWQQRCAFQQGCKRDLFFRDRDLQF